MKYADRPLPAARYNQPIEVPRIYVVASSIAEVDLTFEYERGGEPRKAYFSMSREEAQELLGELNEFINGKWFQDASV